MSDEKETIEDIVEEMRRNAEHNHALVEVSKYLTEIADRIEAAYNREINSRLRIDNSCVAQCAVLLDDHIKAIVAEVKKRSAEAEKRKCCANVWRKVLADAAEWKNRNE